ncbi:MAG TPA: hypothetical protein VJ844_07360 [Mucilaginibacter sp.]|nr:hypothetical protein [Mucilaginibacter sp.]
MNKYLPFIAALLMMGCHADLHNKNPRDSLKIAKQTVAKSSNQANAKVREATDTALSNKIIGIWAGEGDLNATFQVTEKTFYYPDQSSKFNYNLFKDSVVIHYDSYNDTFKVDTKGKDTLILSNKTDGKSVFHRFKD